MKTEKVSWFSDGDRISGLWRTPDTDGPYRAVVQGPGWLGLKDAKLYLPYHEALSAAGIAVLIFDYRGFGDSEGDRTVVSPGRQLIDLMSAVTYLETRDDVVPGAVGAFGSGGTGGGNAVLLAAADARVQAAVAQVPVADGRDWLHRMRSESEWLGFLADLDADRRSRVKAGGIGRLVNPREEIMVPTPERRATGVKADVDKRVAQTVRLSSAYEIMEYCPADAAAKLTKPLLVIGVEGDATTPTDHAIRIYEAANGEKQLILQRHTTHYAAYEKYGDIIAPRIADWFDARLREADIVIRSQSRTTETEAKVKA